MADELSFDILSASLRQDTRDLAVYTDVLSKKLEQAIPSFVEVERQGGLFKKSTAIKRITITLDPWQYRLEVDRGRLSTLRIKMVRGVAIKSEPLTLDAWVDALSQDLLVIAASRQDARQSLERFLLD